MTKPVVLRLQDARIGPLKFQQHSENILSSFNHQQYSNFQPKSNFTNNFFCFSILYPEVIDWSLQQ